MTALRPGSTVNRDMAKGAAWMVGLRMMDRSIGLVSTLVLARLLFPADFGLVTLAAGAVALLELLLAFSLDVALIQRPNPTREHYDTTWTLNLIFSLVIAAGLLGLSGPVAAFYSDPRVGWLMCWLSVGTLCEGLANVGVVDFRRNLQFHKDFIISLARRVVMFVVTVTSAYLLRNYWALVIGMLTGKVVYLIMSYVMHPFRPRLCLTERASLLGMSKWLLVNNILSYIVARGGEIALGRIVSQSATGLFNVARDLATLPTAEFVAPINRAVYPAYARLAQDLARLRKAYLDVIGMTWLIAAPAAAGISAIAELMVIVLLGERWVAAGPPIKILSIYAGLLALQSNTMAVYTAVGRTRIVATLSFLNTAVLIPSLVLLVPRYGVAGAAASYAIATVCYTPYSLWTLHRTIRLRMFELLSTVWRPTVSALGLYLLMPRLATLLGLAELPPGILALVGHIVLGVLVYSFLMLFSWLLSGRPEGAERRAMRMAREGIERAQARLSRTERSPS